MLLSISWFLKFFATTFTIRLGKKSKMTVFALWAKSAVQVQQAQQLHASMAEHRFSSFSNALALEILAISHAQEKKKQREKKKKEKKKKSRTRGSTSRCERRVVRGKRCTSEQQTQAQGLHSRFLENVFSAFNENTAQTQMAVAGGKRKRRKQALRPTG